MTGTHSRDWSVYFLWKWILTYSRYSEKDRVMMLLAYTLFFLTLSLFSHSVELTLCNSMDFGSPWTVGHQDPLSMGFSRQEYLSRFPFPPLEDLPNLGIKTMSPHWKVDYLLLSQCGSSFLTLCPIVLISSFKQDPFYSKWQ